MVDSWGWQYIYFMNLPIGIFGFIMAAFVLKETNIIRKKKFDFAGFFLFISGAFLFVVSFKQRSR